MHQRATIHTGSSLIYVSETTLDETFETSLHSHPNLEILLIAEGEGFIQTTNRKMEIKKGDIVILNPNSKHCELGEGLRFYALGLQKTEVFRKESFKKKVIIEHLPSRDYMTAMLAYQTIEAEAAEKRAHYEDLIQDCLGLIGALLKRNGQVLMQGEESQESSLVSSIKAIIDSHYSSEIRLDDIATRLSTSKSTLCHAFKVETGMSIIEYKILKQLEEAKNMLEISDMNVSEIGGLVGFNSSSYFIKEFRKHFGMSPLEYRRKKKTKSGTC